ncbi:MAG TPA: hypothetical protein PLC07_09160 [Bacillota bacterium]|nr:hypothetical protein [Bacillota bacterium]
MVLVVEILILGLVVNVYLFQLRFSVVVVAELTVEGLMAKACKKPGIATKILPTR